MKTRAMFFILLLAVLAFLAIDFTLLAVAGSTRVTEDGIQFPDGTTQKTAAGSGSTPWVPSGSSNIYYNSGNVGIGTTSPGSKLHVKLSGTSIVDGLRLQTSQKTAEDWYIYMPATDDLTFRNDDKVYVTFQKNTGNVGIGTTSPSEKLEVAGNIEVSGAGNGVKFPDGTVQTTASAPTWHQILPAAERFKLVMNSNAAVLDKETGLVWDKSPDTTTRTWTSACNHCYQREVGGRKGWRLPTIEELSSLVDTSQSNPALPAGHPFTNVQSYYYWSSTTHASYASDAWGVDFRNGNAGINDKGNDRYVWCVRGGYGHDAY